MHDRAAVLSPHSLAPLLAAVTLAEEISRDVSARQSLLSPEPLGRTLKRQSWQEASHVAIFRAARQCLPGDASCPAPLQTALRRYAAQLHADLDRCDLAASMIGLHCVLEGLGAIALQPPPGELATLADSYLPVRSLILHQERGHQRLGEVWIPRLATEPARLQRAMNSYIGLAEAVLEAGLNSLDCLAADRGYYEDAVRAHLTSTEMVLGRHDAERVCSDSAPPDVERAR